MDQRPRADPDIRDAERSGKFIKNSTGHDVSIGLHEGAWATSDLFNQLMLILIEEGLGHLVACVGFT